MPNYGDVALNLPPDWSRLRLVTGSDFMLTAVGHENGVADAHIKVDKDRQHQFRWVAPTDLNAISALRTKHYDYVTKAEWNKNPFLWEWDGEGYIIHNGQRLMARDKQWYDAEKEEERRLDAARERKRADTDEEERTMRKLESRGVTIEDERGRPLKPLSQQKQ